MDYIDKIFKTVSIKDSRRIIELYFQELYCFAPLSNKALSQKLLLPVPIVTAIKNEGIRLGILEQCSGGVGLTHNGKEYVEQALGFKGIDLCLYRRLAESEQARDAYADALSKKYRAAFDERPVADVALDQAQCTVQTAFRRALLCLANGTLTGRQIVCMGDDDFVSLAIGFLLKELYPGPSICPTHIHVLEMDGRYIECLERLAGRFALPISCERVDLRMPLPPHLCGRFDCLFTDPPYTQEGASLFLSRAISVLKEESGLRIFFSFGNKSATEVYFLQKCFQLHGLAIKEMFTRFNEYMGASLLGNKGQLFVLETTERTRALFPLEKRGRDDIYTADRNLRQNRYRCRQCGKVYAVGKEAEYQTIRELKKQGCNVCGATVFDRLHKNGNTDKKQYLPLGHHILADFYNCDPEKLDDVEQIRTFMHEAAVSAGATIVQENFHKYAPVGVSGVVVIQESHLTIHTWPECGYAAVDLFTCGTNVRPWTAFDYLQERLGCAKVEYSDLMRGAYERPSLLRYSETEQPAVRRKKRQRYDASSKWNRRARSLTYCSVLSK